MEVIKALKAATILIIFAGVICGIPAVANQVGEWVEVTDRLQLQIDECRRDTRDFTMLERRVDDAEARILFLETQLDDYMGDERKKAAMMWQFERGVGE